MFSATEKIVDEGFAGVGMGRFVAKGQVVTVAHEFSESDIIQRRAALTEDINVLDVGDRDRRLAGGDAFGGRQQRFHQDRFLRGQIADIFIGFFLAHELVQTGDPLRRRRVLGRVRHDDLAAVLRFDEIFEGLRRIGGLDDVFVVDYADDDVAVARTEVRIDRLFGEILGGRRVVLGENALL